MAAPVRLVVEDGRRIGEGSRIVADSCARLWRRRFHYKDFSAAATTVNYDLTWPPLVMFEGAFIWNIQNWTGGSVGTATLSVGTTGSPALWVAAASVFAVDRTILPGSTTFSTVSPGIFFASPAENAAGGVMRVQLILTGGNANTLTTGAADLYVKIRGVGLRQK